MVSLFNMLTRSQITGASLFAGWYPQWALDYCLLHSAIIVTPDYRLMPESSGLDVLEDVSDFWKWLRKDLQHHLDKLKPGVEADLSRLLVHGESTGGYLSIQSALSQPVGFIKAVIATYPIIDWESKYFTEASEKIIQGVPMAPSLVLDNHLKSMRPGHIITSAEPPDRMDLCLISLQQGRLGEFFGTDERLLPLKRLDKAVYIPYIFILHGRDDSAVPIDGSYKFVEKMRERFWDDKILLHVEPGDHGFDVMTALETPWLKEGLKHVTKQWLYSNDKTK